MEKPKNILETKEYVEPYSFENDQEAVLFYAYLEQEKYIKHLEKQLSINVVMQAEPEKVCEHSDDLWVSDAAGDWYCTVCNKQP